MRRPGQARLASRSLLAAAAVLAAFTIAPAVQYKESTIFDPDGVPDSGDECLIEFKAPQTTPQSQEDVGEMRADFEFALANSADMRTKVEDACDNHGHILEIVLFRDRKDVHTAQTYRNGVIAMDPGDIESRINHMSGFPTDMQALAAIENIRLMAHEIDHNRHRGMGDHLDPPVPDIINGVRGPCVEDENNVLKELNTGIARYNYGRLDSDDTTKVDFVVGARIVVFHLSSYLDAREALSKSEPAALFTVGPSLILLNPGEPCVPGGSPTCYPLIGDNDIDHDGVPDGIDNCIELPNPQQADSDFDGAGTGCDHDDDDDGVSRAIETGAGSHDWQLSSMPEHWACAGNPMVCGTTTDPCTDGIDNDLDNIIDLFDASCIVPNPDGYNFPTNAQPGELLHVYRRPDTGGVPELMETLLASATVRFDYNLDGSIDNVTTADGVVVVTHDPPITGGGGLTSIEGSVLDVSLHGVDTTLGDFLLHTVPGSGNPFQLTAKQVGSDFPANGRIDYTISLETSNFGQLDEVVAGLQSSFVPWWQPFETTWNSFGAPMVFSQDDGTPVVRIISITLSFERDTDFDGSFDSADNCPGDSNPGQEDDDGDLHGDVCDCGAMDGMVWRRPPGLDLFFVDINTLILSPDGLPGSQLDVLDVVRSGDPADFLTGATCVGTDLPPWATGVTDTDGPAPGQINYYLGQLENGCPGTQGEGPAGTASDGTELQVRDCD